MASSIRLFTTLARRARESARRRRSRDLKVESLEPRLAMATGLLSTLVSVVRDDNGRSLLARGGTAEIAEGQDLAALVRLTRRPDSAINVTFQSLAPLEVGVPPTTLKFTRANWNQPQTVWLSSRQDGSRDGDNLVPVKMSVAAAARPKAQAARQIWIESLDSRVVTPLTPVTSTYRGSVGTRGPDNGSNFLVSSYDSTANRGTASFVLTMPQLKNFRKRPITVGYSVGPDNRLQIESLEGIAASRFRWDVTYREFGAERGLFGTVTVLQPKLGTSATATLTASADVGIASDGTGFSGGGFDGNGYAYSWQALGSSNTLAWNGVTFNLGSPGQPNVIHAAGQTIQVPQGNYNVLNLAGAAANGNQTSQKLTLTFTDSSTVVWTQSFSDWGSPQNYGHEAIISTQTYRDTSSGGNETFTNHVYGYSYTIPAGKTLQSITLPTNSDLGFLDLQMSTCTPVDISDGYTNWGIANGQTQVDNKQGFFFGDPGFYYYSGNLQSTIAWGGVTFNLGPTSTSSSGTNNYIQQNGQFISVPQGQYSWVYLAGAANGGTKGSPVHTGNINITLKYTDDSTTNYVQQFSNWLSPQNFSGESIIQMQPNWVNQLGNVKSQTNYVYGYAFPIAEGKTLQSVELGGGGKYGILAISMM